MTTSSGVGQGLPAALAATLAREFGSTGNAPPEPRGTISPRVREAEATLAKTEHDPGAVAAHFVTEASTFARRLPRLSLADESGSDGPPDLALQGMLGQGGMGRVDLAVQLVFDRTVAVKRVRPEHCTAPALRALAHEAAVTGVLDHPNIVPAYMYGQTAGGEPLLVIKRVEGVTWSALLHAPDHPGWQSRTGDRLVWHLEVLRHVCNAVESAHRKGIVHRDLKPENVMVGELGEV